ncbi:MAG: diguanylate cyclase [Pseudomonadota bacterium]
MLDGILNSRLLLNTKVIVFALALTLCTPTLATAETPFASDIQNVEKLLADGNDTEALEQALALRDRTQARAGEDHLRVLGLLSQFYVDHGNAEMALRDVEEALALSDDPNSEMTGRLLLTKTMALIRLGKFEEAEFWAARLRTYGRQMNDQNSFAYGHYLTASTLSRQNQPELAKQNYRAAASVFKDAGEAQMHLQVMNDLAMLFKNTGDFESATTLFREQLITATDSGNQLLRVYALLELGDIARRNGNFANGERYLKLAETIAVSAGNPSWQLFAHEYLAELYRDSDRMDEALRQDNALAVAKAAVDAQRAATRIAELELRRMSAEHDYEISLLKKEQEIREIAAINNKTFRVAVLLGLTLMLICLAKLYQLWRKQTMANSALRESNLRLDQVASTDALTGLGNRHGLSERLTMLRKKRIDYTLILMDIDHFKQINDNFGHDHGDFVLTEFAARIKTRLRQSDYAVRWGGEEFLLILPSTSTEDANDVAKQLHDIIRKTPIVVDGTQHFVTATFGIAAFSDYDDFESTLKGADSALVLGKQSGRDRIIAVDISATGTTHTINRVA